MKKLIVILLLAGSLYSQIPVFSSGNYRDGVVCATQTFSATDTLFTSQIIYWDDPYTVFTGAATLAGGFDLIAGTDTLCTIYVRLIIRYRTETTGNLGTPIYDSNGWHTLATGSGNSIPIENAVTSAYTPYSVNLANETWWKPCVGIIVRYIQHPMSSGTKEMDAYLIPVRYQY